MNIYQVGGSVRDKFLDRKSKDIDLAVEIDSFDSLRNEIKRIGGEIFVEKPEYLTIRAKTKAWGVTDFTLCRCDGVYSDGRHPDSVTPGTIYSDLARRDFTCNAVALRLSDGALVDPHRGVRDIEQRLLRSVGKPQDRIGEDPIRALRALRFAVTLRFSFDQELLNYLKDFDFDKINQTVSEERIREELYKMFSADTKYSLELLFQFKNSLVLFYKQKLWLKPTLEEQ